MTDTKKIPTKTHVLLTVADVRDDIIPDAFSSIRETLVKRGRDVRYVRKDNFTSVSSHDELTDVKSMLDDKSEDEKVVVFERTPIVHRSLVITSFALGILFHLGLNMGIQDWLGLEGYIELVREKWWDLHWGVGLVIAATSSYLYYKILGHLEKGSE